MAATAPEIAKRNTDDIAAGLQQYAYQQCLQFAQDNDPTPEDAGVHSGLISAQDFDTKLYREIQSQKISSTEKQQKLDKLADLMRLLDQISIYQAHKDYPEAGKQKPQALTNITLACLNSIFSLACRTHSWIGAKTEAGRSGKYGVAVKLLAATANFVLGSGLIALGVIFTLHAHVFVAAYVGFCVGKALYKEWNPIMDKDFENRHGTAEAALYQIGKLQDRLEGKQQSVSARMLNRVQSIFTGKLFTNEDEVRSAKAATVKAATVLETAKTKAQQPAVAPTANAATAAEQIAKGADLKTFAYCATFAKGLNIAIGDPAFDLVNNTVRGQYFKETCIKALEDAKDLSADERYKKERDLTLLLRRTKGCAEYNASKDEPNAGKSAYPWLVPLGTFGRLVTASLGSIVTVGGDTSMYAGEEHEQQIIGKTAAAIELGGSAMNMGYAISLQKPDTFLAFVSQPMVYLGAPVYAAIFTGVAVKQQYTSIMQEQYKLRHGAAAAGLRRADLCTEQISPELRAASENTLNNMLDGKSSTTQKQEFKMKQYSFTLFTLKPGDIFKKGGWIGKFTGDFPPRDVPVGIQFKVRGVEKNIGNLRHDREQTRDTEIYEAFHANNKTVDTSNIGELKYIAPKALTQTEQQPLTARLVGAVVAAVPTLVAGVVLTPLKLLSKTTLGFMFGNLPLEHDQKSLNVDATVRKFYNYIYNNVTLAVGPRITGGYSYLSNQFAKDSPPETTIESALIEPDASNYTGVVDDDERSQSSLQSEKSSEIADSKPWWNPFSFLFRNTNKTAEKPASVTAQIEQVQVQPQVSIKPEQVPAASTIPLEFFKANEGSVTHLNNILDSTAAASDLPTRNNGAPMRRSSIASPVSDESAVEGEPDAARATSDTLEVGILPTSPPLTPAPGVVKPTAPIPGAVSPAASAIAATAATHYETARKEYVEKPSSFKGEYYDSCRENIKEGKIIFTKAPYRLSRFRKWEKVCEIMKVDPHATVDPNAPITTGRAIINPKFAKEGLIIALQPFRLGVENAVIKAVAAAKAAGTVDSVQEESIIATERARHVITYSLDTQAKVDAYKDMLKDMFNLTSTTTKAPNSMFSIKLDADQQAKLLTAIERDKAFDGLRNNKQIEKFILLKDAPAATNAAAAIPSDSPSSTRNSL